MKPLLRPLSGNAPLPHRVPKVFPDYSTVPPVAKFQALDWSSRAVLDASKVAVELQTTGGAFVAGFIFSAGYWELHAVPDGTYRLVMSGAGFQTTTIPTFVVAAASPLQPAQDVQQVMKQGFSVYAYPGSGGSSIVLSSAALEHPYGGSVATASGTGMNTVSFSPVPGGTYTLKATAANGFNAYSGQVTITSDYQSATITMYPTGGGGDI